MRLASLWVPLLLALVALASAQDVPIDSGEGAVTDPDAEGTEMEENAEGDDPGAVKPDEPADGIPIEAMAIGGGATMDLTTLQPALLPGVATVSEASGAPSISPTVLRRPSTTPANASSSGSSDDIAVPGGLASVSSTDEDEQVKTSSAASSDSEDVVTKPSVAPTPKSTSSGAVTGWPASSILGTTVVMLACTM